MIFKAYLGIGSNVGNRRANIIKALDLLAEFSPDMVVSSMYETTPDGYVGQRRFINAACGIWTDMSPYELLKKLKEIQTKVGGRPVFVNGPRAVDLDILIYGGIVVNLTDTLTIPHPRLTERLFVLEPLAEIAPNLSHPVSKVSVNTLLHRLRDRHARKFGGRRLGIEFSTG